MRLRRWWWLGLVLALAGSALPSITVAAPPTDGGFATAGATPTLAISPSSATPGQRIHVTVAGAPLNSAPPVVFCLGLYGPGQNPFTNRTPAFRVQIGTVAVGAAGSGQADAILPADLVPGRYQVVVGGCAPHPGLAPLAWFAAAELNVGAGAPPAPTPRVPAGLPRTGGAPRSTAILALILGLGLIGAGARGRRR